MRTLTYIAILFAVTLSNASCFLLEQDETETLGVLHVDGALLQDTCGPGMPTDPSMSFDVELRREGDALVWEGPGSSSRGTVDDDGAFCLELANQWHVRDPDPWYDDPGCDMIRQERICGTVVLTVATETESAQATALAARHETFVAAQPGSVCPEMIGISQGQHLALPCQVVYDLQGLPVDGL